MPTMLTPRRSDETPAFEYLAASGIPDAVESYARDKVRRLSRVAPGPILYARVKLARAPEKGRSGRCCTGQATLDVGGRIVRAHVVADDALEAVDLLHDRLRTQLVRLAQRRRDRRSARSPERAAMPRRAEPLRLGPNVRPEHVVAEVSAVEDAAFELEMFDADFFLFREATTGADALVHHRDDGRLGLVVFGPTVPAPEALVVPRGRGVVVEPAPPVLGPVDAVVRLEQGDAAFVAATDPVSGRPLVAYRRWDGAAAVTTPLPDPSPPSAPWAARQRLAGELDRLVAVQAALRSVGLDAMTECEDVAELSGADQHPADMGTETFERERDISLLAEVDAEIRDVHRALLHVSLGSYGRCEACGERIPDARLSALPAARLCLADQQRAEEAAKSIPHLRR
jgi:RNA polymerase-binding transcription factor DksA/ribosome-associated translation inhibitor RaiA